MILTLVITLTRVFDVNNYYNSCVFDVNNYVNIHVFDVNNVVNNALFSLPVMIY